MVINQRKSGVILSYISVGINIIVGFIYVPLLLKFLGKNEYGLYQLMGSIIAYIAIMDFGLSSTITRYYSKEIALKDKRGQENILAISGIIYTFITLVIAVVSIIIYQYMDDIFERSLTAAELVSAKRIFVIMIVNITVTILSQIFIAIINSNERFIFIKLLTIIQSILKPFVIISVLSFKSSALILVIIQTVFNLVAISINVYYCFAKIKVRFKLHFWDNKLVREMTVFSFFVFLTALMDQVFWKTDQIILGVVAGTSSVAVYSIASQIIMNYMVLSTTMSGIFLPNITKRVAENASDRELSDKFIRIGRLQYLLLGCVLAGFLLFGKQFIILWAGKGFSNAYYITLIIMFPFTIDLIQNIGLMILKAKNLYAFRAKVFFFIAIINVACSIPLAIYYGGIGCAVASAVSYFIGNALIMNVYYLKKVKIDIIGFWKEIFNISIPLSVACFAGAFINKVEFQPGSLNLIFKIAAFVIVYIMLVWNMSMNGYEKILFKKVLTAVAGQIKKSKGAKNPDENDRME